MIANPHLYDLQRRAEAYAQPQAQPLPPPVLGGCGRSGDELEQNVLTLLCVGGACLGLVVGLIRLTKAVKGKSK